MRLGKEWKEKSSTKNMKIFVRVPAKEAKNERKSSLLDEMFKPFDSSDPFEYLILGSGFLLLILMIAGVGL